jgi:hypothetical protein
MRFPWQHWIFQHSSPELLACFLTTPFWGHFVLTPPLFHFNFLSKNRPHREVMNHLRFLQEEEVM